MKQRVRLTESNLHRIVKESVNKILNEKYPRKQGKIQINGEWIDATEDGVDKCGNPMYKTKSDTIKSGRKCKDGSRRIQNFNFRPDITESNLHRIVKESIGGILNESTAFDRKIPEVIEFLEELATRLDNGLLSVNGFEGGNRMFASSSLRDCVKYLKKMNGNLVATDTVVPI